jgi:preprotein translocase subunit SecA
MAPEDLGRMAAEVEAKFGLRVAPESLAGKPRALLIDELTGAVKRFFEVKEAALGVETVRYLERMVFLQIIDAKWKDHLYAMDKLREGIGLRAYGHRDPLIEYKNEAFAGFSEMIGAIEDESVEMIFKLQPVRQEQERISGVFSRGRQQMLHPEASDPHTSERRIQENAAEMQMEGTGSHSPRPGRTSAQPPARSEGPVRASEQKVGRNDPCPCGSGKKYKKCCGK